MSKITFFKNISLVLALLVVVFLVANYTGPIKNQIMDMLHIPGSSVKGASTQRAQEISQKITNDMSAQFGILQEQVLSLKVSDAVNLLSRLQKIPKDAHSVEEFTKKQVDNVLKSKK